jgi:hypothetical protein
MADNKPKSQEERLADAADPTKVKALQAEELGLANILRLKLQIREADKQSKTVQEAINKLTESQLEDIEDYKKGTQELNKALKQEQEIQGQLKRANGFRKTELEDELARQQAIIAARKLEKTELEKTTAVALSKAKQEIDIKALGLKTEKQLIKDINKERGIGGKIMDLFRTKERKDLSVSIARAKTMGGSQTGQPGTAKTTGTVDLAAGSAGSEIAGIVAAAKKMQAPIRELGNQLKNALSAPLADAASLLTGESFGMGGGKVNAGGATSILGGLGSVAKTIPFIGGLLGGVVDGFKAMLDAVLGIEQANFRVARSLNISVEAARAMKDDFIGIEKSSDNIAVNYTRLLQSQVEISNQLGTNKTLSADILENDIKLRDILGLEAESRKVISDQALITGRNAKELTQSAIGTVGAFNKLVGTSFKWSSILGEASKLTGVMGLTLSKFPEKIYNAVAATKALGFDLKQLDSTANSFLDFESSISAEMEAQVITGKDMNLTLAREAALNNDNATLAAEITKNVGSTAEYLGMNRIAQEAIAKSVGMTRDSLADVLKKQEIYARASVTDQEGLVNKLEMLQQQKKTQEEISAILGKDGYETATQVSTAEKLSEIMEKIKRVFVQFVTNSGLFDFLTKPEKIDNFIKGLTERLAGIIGTIGSIIAAVLDGLSHIPGFDKSTFQDLSSQVRTGSENFAGSIRSTSNALGGAVATSLSGTVQDGARQQATQQTTTPTQGAGPVAVSTPVTVVHKMDSHEIGTTTFNVYSELQRALN